MKWKLEENGALTHRDPNTGEVRTLTARQLGRSAYLSLRAHILGHDVEAATAGHPDGQVVPCILCTGEGCTSCDHRGVIEVLHVDWPPELLNVYVPASGDVITRLDEHHADLRVGTLELRFQKLDDHTWEWDEIVGATWMHMEQMSGVSYWMGLSGMDEDGKSDHERTVHVNIGSASGRAQVRATGWSD